MQPCVVVITLLAFVAQAHFVPSASKALGSTQARANPRSPWPRFSSFQWPRYQSAPATAAAAAAAADFVPSKAAGTSLSSGLTPTFASLDAWQQMFDISGRDSLPRFLRHQSPVLWNMPDDEVYPPIRRGPMPNDEVYPPIQQPSPVANLHGEVYKKKGTPKVMAASSKKEAEIPEQISSEPDNKITKPDGTVVETQDDGSIVYYFGSSAPAESSMQKSDIISIPTVVLIGLVVVGGIISAVLRFRYNVSIERQEPLLIDSR